MLFPGLQRNSANALNKLLLGMSFPILPGFVCYPCNLSFPSRDYLRAHLSILHQLRTCCWNDCHQSFGDIISLRRHLEVHLGQLETEIQVTKSSLTGSQSLNSKFTLESSSSSSEMVNPNKPNWNQAQSNIDQIRGHKRTHDELEISSSSLSVVATKSYPVKTVSSINSFDDSNSRDQLKSSEFNNDNGFAISSNNSINPSTVDKTPPNILHLCNHPNCDRQYKRKSELNRHVKTAHTSGEKQFSCQEIGCDFATTRADSLKRHALTHRKSLKNSETVDTTNDKLTLNNHPESSSMIQRSNQTDDDFNKLIQNDFQEDQKQVMIHDSDSNRITLNDI